MIEVEKLNTKLNFLITKLFENGNTALIEELQKIN